jgi:hypothetical protein
MSWTIPESARREACIAAAFAIACQVSLDEFIARLEILGGKFCGTYHGQQCMDVAWDYGFATTIIQRHPAITPVDDLMAKSTPIQYPEGNATRFAQYMRTHVGVLGGTVKKGRFGTLGHAVAWDTREIHDPRGFVYSFKEASKVPYSFVVNNFFMLTKVCQE